MTAPDHDDPTTEQVPAPGPAEAPADPTPEPPVDATPEPEAAPAADPEPPVDGAAAVPEPEPDAPTSAAPVAAPAPRPVPGPRPGPPRPGPRPGAPVARRKAPAKPAEEPVLVDEAEAATWGRVTDDGTVFVRTAEGEREVGQYAAGSPDEALAFFTRRYAALATEVVLLERRVEQGSVSPEEAKTAITKIADQLPEAHAVGDLAGLQSRLDALAPLLEKQRAAKREERAKKVEESRVRKEHIVGEAEKLGAGRNWRDGANRLRDLLEEWKTLPRLDRASDDALWRRFSSARTAYTRARKSHFSELDEKRGEARVVKERLIKEAEALSASTEWGPTAGKYRDLMDRWKAAGPAAKAEDDALWKRFRGAQDAFFGAREAANTAQDAEFEANAVVKDGLLVEAEKLLPIKNLDAAKRAFRDIAEKWEAAGKVPRGRMKDLEARIRKVETAIRGAEDAKWTSTDPEKSARADDMIAKLEKAIAGIEANLDKARAADDARTVKQLEDDLAGRQMFLEAARRTAADFS